MADTLFHMGFDGGVTHSSAYEEDGQIILTETMPANVVQEILDANHETARDNPLSSSRNSLGVVGARIPITEHYKWKREWKQTAKKWGIPWHKFLKSKLNDPNYSKFKFMKL